MGSEIVKKILEGEFENESLMEIPAPRPLAIIGPGPQLIGRRIHFALGNPTGGVFEFQGEFISREGNVIHTSHGSIADVRTILYWRVL
jgi:hypothetical protein